MARNRQEFPESHAPDLRAAPGIVGSKETSARRVAYAARWFDPVTGLTTQLGEIRSDDNGL